MRLLTGNVKWLPWNWSARFGRRLRSFIQNSTGQPKNRLPIDSHVTMPTRRRSQTIRLQAKQLMTMRSASGLSNGKAGSLAVRGRTTPKRSQEHSDSCHRRHVALRFDAITRRCGICISPSHPVSTRFSQSCPILNAESIHKLGPLLSANSPIQSKTECRI